MNNIMVWLLPVIIGGSILIVGLIALFIILHVVKTNRIKKSNEEADKKVYDSADKVSTCFGGKDNISSISQQGSRVTVAVKDTSLIDKEAIDRQFSSVMYMGSKIVFVIGSMSEEFSALLKEKLEQ